MKNRSLPVGRCGPDLASGSLNDFFADSQADTTARVLVQSMEALERSKDGFQVSRFDADTVVRYGETPEAGVFPPCPDVNVRRFIRPAVLDRISDEVLEEQPQRNFFGYRRWVGGRA